MRRPAAFLMMLSAAFIAVGAAAHDGVDHATAEEAAQHLREQPAAAGPVTPFPVQIDAQFSLIDQNGRAVSQDDFKGRPTAIFFGYANCEAICSVALPRLAAALDLLGEDGADIQPLLITVDPVRDTPATMKAKLPDYHDRLTGLTGSEEALAAARNSFQVEAKVVAEDPTSGPIYAHGSFIYLLGPDLELLTLMPPVLTPERMAELMRGYL